MADYYSLLSKLLDSLPDSTAQVRQGVYDRARRALSEQLKTVKPALTPQEIEREAASLEEAIGQLEARHERNGAVRSGPQPTAKTPARQAEPDENRPPPPQAEDEMRPDPVAIKRGGRRGGPRALLLGLVLLAIPVAVLAWLWRDERQALPEPATQPQVATPSASTDQKYAERIAGPTRPPGTAASPALPDPPKQDARAPAATPLPTPPAPAASARPQAQPAPEAANPAPAPPSSGNELAVAQKALIFEENQVDPQQPIISAGRAIWRLDAVNGGQGMPLETVIRGRVELPAAGLSLGLTLRRNTDAALPASHTIELAFAMSSVSGSPPRIVRDVALPVMRPEESIRGVPLAGLPVPVKENLFLIGLSDLKGDIERNTELLLRRNWMEIPIRFASGQKAALLFDKGVSGERVFLDAFRQWGQAPP